MVPTSRRIKISDPSSGDVIAELAVADEADCDAAVDSDAEAVALANATEYGLIGYAYTRNLQRGVRIAAELQSGMVALNKRVISEPAAPFGGYKQSGLGQEGGFHGIQEFLETKYVGVTF